MKAIFFDLDGTLLHFTRDYRDVLADAFRSARGEVRDEWIDDYDDAFYDLFAAHEPDPVRSAFAAVEGDTDPDALAVALREAEVKTCQPPENVETDLARLAEDYELGVLTNGVREWQEHKLRESGLDRYFDAFVASYETGGHKPDAAPYRFAEDRLPADDYALVGDSDGDVEGARNAGWTAHQYAGEGFGEVPGVFGWE